jgi:zinc protease
MRIVSYLCDNLGEVNFMIRTKVLFWWLTVFFIAGLTQASADTFKPASLFPANALHVKVLSNGAHAVVRTTPGSGVASLQVWVEAGSRFETASNNGATHIIEMLAMQGSKNYPTQTAGQLSGPQVKLENLGGQVNSLTSRDDVFWSVTLASSGLPQATKIMADAVLNPDLSDTSVAAAKAIAANDWVQSRVDPMGYASELAYQEAFPKHPYRQPAQGDLNSIKALTGHNVREYDAQRFTGSHLHVVVVGDVDAAATMQLLESTFGNAPKTVKAETPIPSAEPLKGVHQISKRGVLPIQIVTLAWRSPGITSPKETVATDILLTYLNEGSNAKLRQVLQNGAADEDAAGNNSGAQPTGLAGGFSADYLTQHDSGLFLINIIAPTDMAQATAAVRDLMVQAGTGLAAPDLENAKTLLRRQYVQQANNTNGQAGAIGFYDAIDSYQYAVNYLNLVQQTTSEDIAKVAKKYFSSDNYVQVTLLPALNNQQQNNSPGIVASLRLEEPRA